MGRVALNQERCLVTPERLGAFPPSRGPAKQSCSPLSAPVLAGPVPATFPRPSWAVTLHCWGDPSQHRGDHCATPPGSPQAMPTGTGAETLAESHQHCLMCFFTHAHPLGTNLVPGEGREERQEALCHQLFPLCLAVEVLGFLAAAKEQAVPCREQTRGAVLGTEHPECWALLWWCSWGLWLSFLC